MLINNKFLKVLFFVFFNCSFSLFSQNSGIFKDKRDQKAYKWVKIGEQIWMAENLAFLPSVSPIFMELNEAETEPKYFVYGYDGTSIKEANLLENFKTYGVLYNWIAALKACPEGWHLPSDLEWKFLETYLGMTQNELNEWFYRQSGKVGMKLKGKYNWNDLGNGQDVFGFNVLPAGFRHDGDHLDDKNNGGYSYLKDEAFFWSSTQYSDKTAFRRHFSSLNKGVDRYPGSRSSGYSVRCLKD